MAVLIPHEFRLGAVDLEWIEIDPGVVVIHASGGTVEDRESATLLTRVKLAQAGFEHAEFEIQPDKGSEFQKTAHWNDDEEIVMVSR